MTVGDKNRNPTAKQAQYIFNLVYDEDAQALRMIGLDSIGGLKDRVVIIKLDETTTFNVVYVGRALPGSDDADAVWEIRRIDKRVSPITILRADGNGEFDNVWDDRDSLSYS